jgi:hypothetical protein
MPIYRVTFQTELLVDCENESEAERIGFKHLEDEVRNRTSEVYRVEKLDSVDQLRRAERGSLPWRRYERNSMGESFYMVDEILERNVASG